MYWLGFCFKIAPVLALVLLVGCSQSPTAFVVREPQEVIVNSTPAKEVVVAPEPVTEELIDSEPARPVHQQTSEPVPEVVVYPERKPEKVQSCIKGCEWQCDADAMQACSQGTAADCKFSCGKIIDPSACSVACSFRRAGSCESKFRKFCTSQCEAKCH